MDLYVKAKVVRDAIKIVMNIEDDEEKSYEQLDLEKESEMNIFMKIL